MPIKVGMVSLGCSKNLVDSERMLYKLRQKGYELVTEPGLADIAVVNTCGFIQSAKEEAIETIMELGALKRDGTLKKIILTGCLTERYQQEVADLIEEADAVVGITDQRDIVDILEGDTALYFDVSGKLTVDNSSCLRRYYIRTKSAIDFDFYDSVEEIDGNRYIFTKEISVSDMHTAAEKILFDDGESFFAGVEE